MIDGQMIISIMTLFLVAVAIYMVFKDKANNTHKVS